LSEVLIVTDCFMSDIFKIFNDKSSVNYMLKISGFAYCIKHFVNLSLLLQNMSQYLMQK